MHKVKRAVIMAAGKGERLRPLTLTTPKPLLPVNGKMMIESVIEALHENGIYEIYIVTGYLKEKFAFLKDRAFLIENPYFESANNISSLYMAREHLEDAMILDGDQIIYNSKVLSPFFEKSGYNALYTESHTKEWLLDVKDGSILSCKRNGGDRGYILYSVSRWTSEDGKKLKKHLEEEFEKKKNYSVYWDDIPVFLHSEEYSLGIREIRPGDIVEIDSLSEYEAEQAACKYKEKYEKN